MNPGDTIDRYEVLRVLGEGGMASVYLVRHHVLGSQHALKVLNADSVRDDDIRERFVAEGRIQAQLRHPHILPVTDVVAAPGVAGLVMEFIDGPTLEEWAEEQGAIPADVLRPLFRSVLAAVGEAHAHGVVHRDLKPANILLKKRRDGGVHPLIADFGIAKIAEDARLKHERRGRTGTSVRMGTLAYMSPEQILHAADVDQRSDIFSLGAILHELATGKPAFDGATEYQIMNRIVEGSHDTLELDGVDTRIAACIRRALMRDPEERFADCEMFATYLLESAAGPPAATTSTPITAAPVTNAPVTAQGDHGPSMPDGPIRLTPIPAVARPRRRRSPIWGWLLAAVLVPSLLCLGAGAWYWPEAELWWATHVTTNENTLKRTLWTASHGMRLRYVPSGAVVMGLPPSESGRDRDEVQRTAHLSRPVLMMETEVTQAQWQAVMGSEPNKTRRRFWDGRAGGPCHEQGVDAALPVTCVDWFDAVAFANALSLHENLEPAYTIRGSAVTMHRKASGYRLPTEAEWERAARYDRGGRYGPTDSVRDLCSWANVAGADTRAKDRAPYPPVPCADGYPAASPVGSLRPNALGVYDLVGNAWEWVWDIYDPNPSTSRVTDPSGPRAGTERVIRGGSWYNHAEIVRVANRFSQAPQGRSGMVGFRMVRAFRPADASNGRPAR